MTASPCARCGAPVLADRHAPGWWVDQWNGRHCGGDARFPHQAPQKKPRKKQGHTLWIVAGCVAAVAVLAAAVVVVVVLNRGPDEPAVAQVAPTRPSTQEKEPSATPDRPKAAEAPVPCEPGKERSRYCFPSTTRGAGFLARIEKAMKWRCYEAGEKDRSGLKLSNAECQAVNSVDQSYTKRVSIGYETHDREKGGAMNEVKVVASTHAENRGTTVKNTAALATDAFEIAVIHLWPGNKKLQNEAKQALVKAQRQCKPDHDPQSVPLSIGYEVGCGTPTPIVVTSKEGKPVMTITQSLDIAIPYDYGWD
ncbi:hypothetical protein [Nonomuraea diastatica]|uniref:Uncharacterized protein n=1 Tax=Nonomuraea diastatica TaxID=1848329 RepID=A0A4R4X0J3_9ACTN|nr:hypothetical protein [Nonomuraea diastatica]TDD23694.1 hypothetical protein E1294_08190 [Nonomuraea diastatica]